jgi:L-fucose isomerase-like protein
MDNLPDIRVGIVSASRDCFPAELAVKRKERIIEGCKRKNFHLINVDVVVENENDIAAALDCVTSADVNALVIFLGNFGPEGPVSMLVEKFDGPVMLCGAAEESTRGLILDRGDAYCGMISATYNIGLRGAAVYLPECPLGGAAEVADMIEDFVPVARAVIGVGHLKIFGFGPRPQDFLTCNAPLKPLFDLGVEVMENSELDLYDHFTEHAGQDVTGIVEEMNLELKGANPYPELSETLARYENSLVEYKKENLGAATYGAFAIKCWPKFEKYFGFAPCYVNSRMMAKGIPVACETDIYGALSQYVAMAVTGKSAAILDINNTVPADMICGNQSLIKEKGYQPSDLWMGFHCGNVPSGHLCDKCDFPERDQFELKYHRIMHRLMEPDSEPDITRGTLEGTVRPGNITIFRLQGNRDSQLSAYVAEGEILDIDPHSFGSTGVFAIPEMARFYRYALLENGFAHHTIIAFGHVGKQLFNALKLLGVDTIYYNLPKGVPYRAENPFNPGSAGF